MQILILVLTMLLNNNKPHKMIRKANLFSIVRNHQLKCQVDQLPITIMDFEKYHLRCFSLQTILKISPNLKNLSLLCSKRVYRGYKKKLSKSQKPREMEDYQQTLDTLSKITDLKVSSHGQQQEIFAVVDALPFKGVVHMIYKGRFPKESLQMFTLMKCRFSLCLYSYSEFDGLNRTLSCEDTENLLRLSPVLQRIHLRYGVFQDPQLLIRVLNSLEKLDSIWLAFPWQTSVLDLSQLKTRITQLKLEWFFSLKKDELSTILNNNPMITSLSFDGCELFDDHLAEIPQVNKFTTILIQGYYHRKITCIGISIIVERCQNLVELNLDGFLGMKDKAVMMISTLQQLEVIGMENCLLTSKGVIYLKKLRKLKGMTVMMNNKNSFPVLLQILKIAKGVRSFKFSFESSSKLLNDSKTRNKMIRENLKKGLGIRNE